MAIQKVNKTNNNNNNKEIKVKVNQSFCDYKESLQKLANGDDTENIEQHVNNIFDYKFHEIDLRIESLNICLEEQFQEFYEKTDVCIEKIRALNRLYMSEAVKIDFLVHDIPSLENRVREIRKSERVYTSTVNKFMFESSRMLPAKEKIGTLPTRVSESREDLIKKLEKARKDLKTCLGANDIRELKTYRLPPPMVKHTGEAICLLFGLKPSWSEFRKLAASEGFIKMMIELNPDKFTNRYSMERLQKYLSKPEFNPYYLEQISKCCPVFCKWLRAIFDYYSMRKPIIKENKRQPAQLPLKKKTAFSLQ